MAKTYAQIRRDIDRLTKLAEQLRRKEAPSVLLRIREAIEVYGFTASDLGLSADSAKPSIGKRAGTKSPRRPTGKAPIKYRDGEGNKWSGRGLQPRWLKAALSSGRTIDEFRV